MKHHVKTQLIKEYISEQSKALHWADPYVFTASKRNSELTNVKFWQAAVPVQYIVRAGSREIYSMEQCVYNRTRSKAPKASGCGGEKEKTLVPCTTIHHFHSCDANFVSITMGPFCVHFKHTHNLSCVLEATLEWNSTKVKVMLMKIWDWISTDNTT
jgi:hypothetical protein